MLAKLLRNKLSDQESSEIVRELLKAVLDRCTPERVTLFGSAARGELTDGSDVDLALLFSDNVSISQARKALYSKGPLISWPVDLIYFTIEDFEQRKETSGLCHLIAQEGKILWENKK